MKKVLITGANSYIGTSLERWLNRWRDKYYIETVDMTKESWREKDFSEFDVVFHVAGIAHISTNPKMEDLYYKVNRDLAVETAKKAKAEGVKQFIFMSSIIVYGDSGKIKCKKIINFDTVPKPTNFYGKSKLQAEEGIRALMDDSFRVVILRPPMVYGKGSKGNYSKLSMIAQKFPFFPDVQNERSMLFIDSLCEFIRLMINNNESGIFFPQDNEYVCTSNMVRLIAKAHGRNIRLTKLFNSVILLLSNFIDLANKAFGNLVYDMSMSGYKENYRVCGLMDAIMSIEGDKNA